MTGRSTSEHRITKMMLELKLPTNLNKVYLVPIILEANRGGEGERGEGEREREGERGKSEQPRAGEYYILNFRSYVNG